MSIVPYSSRSPTTAGHPGEFAVVSMLVHEGSFFLFYVRKERREHFRVYLQTLLKVPWLASAGAGLHFLLPYGLILRTEFSVNALGQFRVGLTGGLPF